MTILTNLLAAYRHHRDRTAAIRDLSRMPDELLSDIGISSGQIAAAVDGMLERPSAKRAVPRTSRWSGHVAFASGREATTFPGARF